MAWTPLALATATATNGATLTITGNEVEASGLNPLTSIYTITTNVLFGTGITGFRLGALLDADLPGNGPGRQPTNGNFILTEFEVGAVDAEVPEPGTLLLLSSGVGLAAIVRRRRRT